jgi:hypothetical protein
MFTNKLKFGLSEKHTKFEKLFLMVLKNQLIYLVNVKTMRKIFSNYVCFSKSPNFTVLQFVQVFFETDALLRAKRSGVQYATLAYKLL